MIMAMEARLKPAMKKAGVEILDKPEDERRRSGRKGDGSLA